MTTGVPIWLSFHVIFRSKMSMQCQVSSV